MMVITAPRVGESHIDAPVETKKAKKSGQINPRKCVQMYKVIVS